MKTPRKTHLVEMQGPPQVKSFKHENITRKEEVVFNELRVILERLPLANNPIKKEKFVDYHNNASVKFEVDEESEGESSDFYIVEETRDEVSFCLREPSPKLFKTTARNNGILINSEQQKENIKIKEENWEEDTNIKEEETTIKEEAVILDEEFHIHENKTEENKGACNDIEDSKLNVGKFNAATKRYKRKKGREYNCYHCSYKTVNRGHIELHLNLHLEPSRRHYHECPHCNFKTLYRHSWRIHLSGHQNPEEKNWLECKSCLFKTIYKHCLKNHIKKYHSVYDVIQGQGYSDINKVVQIGKRNRIPKYLANDVLYKCYNCQFETENKKQLARHMLKHRTTGLFQCQYCSYKTPYKNRLKRHLGRHEEYEELIKWHQCSHCNFKTREKKTLKDHCISFHETNVNYYYCSECDYKSKLKYNLTSHKLIHKSIDTWFFCSECPYKSPDRRRLNRHYKVKHTNDYDLKEKVYKCDICIFQTKVLNSLNKHKMTVHGIDVEKWHICDLCRYKTISKRSFDDHVEKHKNKGDVLQKCTECKYTTKSKGNLRAHMITHLPDDKIPWFNCTECPYRSKKKYYLVKHQKWMHQYIYCFNCTFKTHNKKYLVSHMKTVHTTKGT